MAKKKLITFYHVKDYLESGAVKMQGHKYEHDKTTMRGILCDGVKMTTPYLYFKDEYAFTKKGAIKLGNKIIRDEIKHHKKQIIKLKKKLK